MDMDRWIDGQDAPEMQDQMVDDEMMAPDASVGDTWVMAGTHMAWYWAYT